MKKVILCLFILLSAFTQGCCQIFTLKPHNISVDSLTQSANVNKTRFHEQINPDEASIVRGKIYAISVLYKSKNKTQTLQKSIREIFWVSMFFWPEFFIDLAMRQVYENEPVRCEFNFNQ